MNIDACSRGMDARLACLIRYPAGSLYNCTAAVSLSIRLVTFRSSDIFSIHVAVYVFASSTLSQEHKDGSISTTKFLRSARVPDLN